MSVYEERTLIESWHGGRSNWDSTTYVVYSGVSDFSLHRGSRIEDLFGVVTVLFEGVWSDDSVRALLTGFNVYLFDESMMWGHRWVLVQAMWDGLTVESWYFDFPHWQGGLHVYSFIPVFFVLFCSFVPSKFYCVINRSFSGVSFPLNIS